jgi:urease accessory protein
MVIGLGVPVYHEDAPFEPEGGAYAAGHRHGDDHHHHRHHHHHD